MGLIAVEFQVGFNIHQFTVDPCLAVAFFGHLDEELMVMTFTGTYHGCQQHEFLAAVVFLDNLNDLLFGIADEFFT